MDDGSQHRRFVEGVLHLTSHGDYVIETASGREHVEPQDGTEAGLGSTELWVLSPRPGETTLAHLDPNAFRKRRAAEKRAQQWADLKKSDASSPGRSEECVRCGVSRSDGNFPTFGNECYLCRKLARAEVDSAPPMAPDDRDPSTSIRTVRGGLPSHGRRR